MLSKQGGWGSGQDISSSWVKIRLHAKFQLPRLPGSGSFMVGGQQKQNKKTTTR